MNSAKERDLIGTLNEAKQIIEAQNEKIKEILSYGFSLGTVITILKDENLCLIACNGKTSLVNIPSNIEDINPTDQIFISVASGQIVKKCPSVLPSGLMKKIVSVEDGNILVVESSPV